MHSIPPYIFTVWCLSTCGHNMVIYYKMAVMILIEFHLLLECGILIYAPYKITRAS
jgi:hypothetical protein